MPERRELLMPVSDDQAYKQIEIEALRGIADSVKRSNDCLKELSAGLKELSGEVRTVDKRLTRIEANKLEPTVDKLKADVEELLADKYRRDGALGLAAWSARNWPAIIGYLILLASMLAANGKLPA